MDCSQFSIELLTNPKGLKYNKNIVLRVSQSTKGTWRENHKIAFCCKVATNSSISSSIGKLFVVHTISNFLAWTLRFVPGIPWEWWRLITLLILGGGFATILKTATAFVFTNGVYGENNGLACKLILMTTWGDGEALDVEVDEDCDREVELGDFLNNCLGVRNSLSKFNENCPKVVSNILDVDLIRLPLTPSKKGLYPTSYSFL